MNINGSTNLFCQNSLRNRNMLNKAFPQSKTYNESTFGRLSINKFSPIFNKEEKEMSDPNFYFQEKNVFEVEK